MEKEEIIGLIALIIVCFGAYMILRGRRPKKVLNSSEKIPVIEFLERKAKKYDLVFLKWYADTLGLKFPVMERKRSIKEQFDYDMESNWALLEFFAEKIKKIYLENELFRNFLLLAKKDNSSLRFILSKGECSFLKKENKRSSYKEFYWILDLNFFYDRNEQLEKISLCMDTYRGIYWGGERIMGVRLVSFDDLDSNARGEVLKILLLLCQKESAIPFLLATEEMKYAVRQVKDRNPDWLEKMNLPDLEIVKLLGIPEEVESIG